MTRKKIEGAHPRLMINALFVKQHKCSKMYGASRSCFIACPTDDNLEPILELISEKLSKLGIEPVIAVKERAYGQDIFCTKICGKIIESQFCIVILDDTLKSKTNIPNPNVYYEYGLMTAGRKHIIPLQKEDLESAFNIQSYDTIKYNLRSIGTELERAIRDAVKLTESTEQEKTKEELSDKIILRKMEMAGFVLKDNKWFLSEVIDDTAFRGFGQHVKGFYAYVGKIDIEEDMQIYLDDLSVAIYRTEKKVKEIQTEINDLTEQHKEREKEVVTRRKEKMSLNQVTREMLNFSDTSVKSLDEKIIDLKSKLQLMSDIFISFFITPDLNVSDFLKSASAMTTSHERYKLTFSHEGKIEFEDFSVNVASGLY